MATKHATTQEHQRQQENTRKHTTTQDKNKQNARLYKTTLDDTRQNKYTQNKEIPRKHNKGLPNTT